MWTHQIISISTCAQGNGLGRLVRALALVCACVCSVHLWKWLCFCQMLLLCAFHINPMCRLWYYSLKRFTSRSLSLDSSSSSVNLTCIRNYCRCCINLLQLKWTHGRMGDGRSLVHTHTHTRFEIKSLGMQFNNYCSYYITLWFDISNRLWNDNHMRNLIIH